MSAALLNRGPLYRCHRHGRRSQIKMFESIAMLLVFFFLVAIGIRFYGGYEISQLQSMKDKFAAFDSVKMAILLSNLPEVKCSIQNVQGGACVDLYKLKAWNAMQSIEPAQSYYFDLLGHATVTLEQIEPVPPPGTGFWVMHNKTPDANFSTIVTPMPVTIWDPAIRQKSFGVLYVRVHIQ